MVPRSKIVSPYNATDPVRDYGCKVKGLSQLLYDRWAYANRIPEENGTPPRLTLFKNVADTLVPGWFEWHSWTDKIIEAGSTDRWIGISGCSNSAKTRNVAGFACTWWLMDPENSSVIFCSTTMKMLRKRGWNEVQNYHRALGGDFGNMVNSQTVWQFNQGDDKHAIFCLAVNEGDINKTAANIQGIHTRRQLVIIDEAEAVPAAIWKACSNLWGYPIDNGGEFLLFAIANPRSRLSQFGRFIEPTQGWESVSIDTEEWIGKAQLDGNLTKVIRFDFRKSPNIVEGKSVSKHLPNKARVSARMKQLQERGAENDPDHWCYDLGFPAPEGLSKTVFTETMLIKFDGYSTHKFTGNNFMIIGAFDQAFGGGDRPCLRFAALGEIGLQKMGIELLPPIEIFIDAESKQPVRYQLLSQIKKQSESVTYRGAQYQCLPSNLAIDCTGDGGLGDIAQQEWHAEVIRILFSSSPSEEPCSFEDTRLAKDVYRNKRAEMYFRTRNALFARQLKGMDKDTAAELCSLEYDDSKMKILMQDKKEYKIKFGKSPDLADTCGMILEVARLKGFRLSAVGITVTKTESHENLINKAQKAMQQTNYTEAQMPSDDEDLEYVGTDA